MNNVLEVKFSGWTSTPRMPFVLSGNAICMPVPSYSILLGVVGCCLGRLVSPNEVAIGFQYSFDSIGKDLETRHRLEFDGKRVKTHTKGTDAYLREFHVSPNLTLWLDRLDWEQYFQSPIGTPSLGRSQDLIKIEGVRQVGVVSVAKARLSGCMLPFNPNLRVGGQLVQLAEAFEENEGVGQGRKATNTRVFMAIPIDNESNIEMSSLYQTLDQEPKSFYLHQFTSNG